MQKKNSKKISPLLGRILQKIAPRIGATVILEPKWNIVGQIKYKSGVLRYFRYSSLDLNTMGASEIARDKDYANFFMEKMGYPVIPNTKTFFSTRWGKAIGAPEQNIHAGWKHAQKIGLPVIVKPNSASQGTGVALVHTKQEYYRAMREIFAVDRVALVQTPVTGKDYRIVVLDKNIICAYERIALSVVGDGKKNIRALLEQKQKHFIASKRDTQIKITDPRIREKLKRQKYSLASIPKKNERVVLLDNANLSTGGDSIDVTKTMHPEFRKIAIKLTRDMGLRVCGVDLMIDGDIIEKPGKYFVIEINSAPGLDHYITTGKEQEKIVEDLYLKVLKNME